VNHLAWNIPLPFNPAKQSVQVNLLEKQSGSYAKMKFFTSFCPTHFPCATMLGYELSLKIVVFISFLFCKPMIKY